MVYASPLLLRLALELHVVVPDASRGPGFWFITVNRSRSDGWKVSEAVSFAAAFTSAKRRFRLVHVH
jgi:hypothetical protein